MDTLPILDRQEEVSVLVWVVVEDLQARKIHHQSKYMLRRIFALLAFVSLHSRCHKCLRDASGVAMTRLALVLTRVSREDLARNASTMLLEGISALSLSTYPF